MADDLQARLDAMAARDAASGEAKAIDQRRAARGTGPELMRQVGLAARAAGPAGAGALMGGMAGGPVGALGGAAIGGIAMPVADLAVNGYNRLTGSNAGLPSRAFDEMMTKAGLPEPETGTERVVQGASRALIDTATGGAAARALLSRIPQPGPVATPGRAVAQSIADNPAAQIGSASVGATTAGTAAEAGAGPLTSMALGIAGGSVPYMARPNALLPQGGPEQQRLVRSLEAEGIPITPGQRANSPFGRVVESVLKYLPTSATRSAAIEDDQMRTFTRSVMRHAGLTADDAAPETLRNARTALGREYDQLEAATQIQPDRQFLTDLQQVHSRYAQGFDDSVRGVYQQRLQDLVEFARQGPNGARVDGGNFRALQSQLAEDATAATRSGRPSDLAFARAMRGMQDSLEGLVERSAAPGLADRWRDLNRRYAVFSIIEDTMGQAGQEKLRTGFIPPQGLGGQVRGRDKRAWAEERNAFGNLARAGAAILPDPVPNSGTTQRSGVQNALTGGTRSAAAAAAGAGASHFGLIDPVLGLAGPYAASRMWYGRNYTQPEQALIGAQAGRGSLEGLLGPQSEDRRPRR